MPKRKIIVVLGATASGKSKIALDLAKKFNGFLISADSRQIYKRMDIGTNKDELTFSNGQYFVDGVPEFLVNAVEPDESFTLDDWLISAKALLSVGNVGNGKRESGRLINDSCFRLHDKTPIVVGGTGLYISALVDNFELRGGLDLELRKKIKTVFEDKGSAGVLEMIKESDSEIENKIDIKNPRRVMRAAEICLSTGKPLDWKKGESEFEFLLIGVEKDRKEVYEKINQRVDQMISGGLVEEVKKLMDAGYACTLPSMTGIGYRQICDYLNGKCSLEQAVELIKRDTRRYAKRQMTWFRRDKRIRWVKSSEEAENLVADFIK